MCACVSVRVCMCERMCAWLVCGVWPVEFAVWRVCIISSGKLGFDPDIWNNKLKLSGYVEEAYLTTVPKVPNNPVAGFSKMAE